MANILIAEDDTDLAELWRDVLEDAGHHVVVVHTGLDAVNALAANTFNLVISDVNMPDGGGVLVASETRSANEATAIIVVSGDPAYAKSDEFSRMQDFGRCRFLDKPVSLQRLKEAVSKALDARADN